MRKGRHVVKNERIMIDTNIFLDVLLNRESLADSSSEFLELSENNVFTGLVTSSCITDIFYIVRKHLKSTDAAYFAVGKILNIASVCNVTGSDVMLAYERHARDFEDCLLAVCAISNDCHCIVTRNKPDFSEFDIPCLTPEEWLAKRSE